MHERLTYLRNLEEKKEQVLGSIEEQGKLTEELKEKILAAQTLVVVEDLYRPYRPKRKTRASVAKAKGLEPLADYILAQDAQAPLLEAAAAYVTGSDGAPPQVGAGGDDGGLDAVNGPGGGGHPGGGAAGREGYHCGEYFRQCGLPDLHQGGHHGRGCGHQHGQRRESAERI